MSRHSVSSFKDPTTVHYAGTVPSSRCPGHFINAFFVLPIVATRVLCRLIQITNTIHLSLIGSLPALRQVLMSACSTQTSVLTEIHAPAARPVRSATRARDHGGSAMHTARARSSTAIVGSNPSRDIALCVRVSPANCL
jgi:hypothetical protein